MEAAGIIFLLWIMNANLYSIIHRFLVYYLITFPKSTQQGSFKSPYTVKQSNIEKGIFWKKYEILPCVYKHRR